MKRSILIIMTGVILLTGMAGCQKSPKHVTHIPPRQGGIVGADDPEGPRGGRAGEFPGGATLPTGFGPGGQDFPYDRNQLPDRESYHGMSADRETFNQHTVYFDFDRSTVKTGDQRKIEAVASYLKSEPGTKVQVEGHCDERGTEEYNRALGERRALAVRDYLMNLGIEGDRIFTISYGEDLPAVDGYDENAYRLNRRAEFVLLRP
jgi:peptidoglycan-associated lipoprotein